jgi:hypothetical protein
LKRWDFRAFSNNANPSRSARFRRAILVLSKSLSGQRGSRGVTGFLRNIRKAAQRLALAEFGQQSPVDRLAG